MREHEYEMSDEDYQGLIKACRPTPVIVIRGKLASSQQDNANAYWHRLGDKKGFDHLTVRPHPTKGDRFFFAVPKEPAKAQDAPVDPAKLAETLGKMPPIQFKIDPKVAEEEIKQLISSVTGSIEILGATSVDLRNRLNKLLADIYLNKSDGMENQELGKIAMLLVAAADQMVNTSGTFLHLMEVDPNKRESYGLRQSVQILSHSVVELTGKLKDAIVCLNPEDVSRLGDEFDEE